MSKIKTDFMKKLAEQPEYQEPEQEQQENIAQEPEEDAPEIESKAAESESGAAEGEKSPDTAQNVEEDVAEGESDLEQDGGEGQEDLEGEVEEQAERPRSRAGRPTSFPEGEKKERIMVTISEVDKEALRLFQETTSGAKDRSEIVRAALAAYIPENIYTMANMMVKVKRSAI